jgi:hypothetical protein
LPKPNGQDPDLVLIVAADEGRRISERTQAALAAYKKGKCVSKRVRATYPNVIPTRIVKANAGRLEGSLGQCWNLTPAARQKGTAAAARARSALAASAYDHLTRLIRLHRTEKLSAQDIADRLIQLGHGTVSGCPWNRSQVKRVLDRLGRS